MSILFSAKTENEALVATDSQVYVSPTTNIKIEVKKAKSSKFEIATL